MDALAGATGRSVHETAEAIIKVAISDMFVEVNKLIARYGVDPRDFTLLPFGGAGPMLGCLLARELGIERVMIPLPSRRRFRARRADRGREERFHPHGVPRDEPKRRCRCCAAALVALIGQAEDWLRHEQNYAGAGDTRSVRPTCAIAASRSKSRCR